jgi:hypothetical protein
MAPPPAARPAGSRFVNTSAARAPPPQAMPQARAPQTMPQAGAAPPAAAPAPAAGMGMMGMMGTSMAGGHAPAVVAIVSATCLPSHT